VPLFNPGFSGISLLVKGTRSVLFSESKKKSLIYMLTCEVVVGGWSVTSIYVGSTIGAHASWSRACLVSTPHLHKSESVVGQWPILCPVHLNLSAVPFQRINSVFLSLQINININHFSSQPNSALVVTAMHFALGQLLVH
jgi:hypothetical protein